MSDPYFIIEPGVIKVPIILSVPHSGTEFPKELQGDYIASKMTQPDDTDWFVHQLYDFAVEYGITIIHAKYSRWVIDLNRDPKSVPLYNDGRIITGLTTSTDFFGKDIYISEDKIPDKEEIERRLEAYYWPYYAKIEALLKERQTQFGKALLWDAHSIRRSVPTIQKDFFPDMILGNNDEKTADPKLIEVALDNLKSGEFQVNHNAPFKGGHITRYFGDPSNSIHSLQLEMNKILYMDDSETSFDELRANKMRSILRKTFAALIDKLNEL